MSNHASLLITIETNLLNCWPIDCNLLDSESVNRMGFINLLVNRMRSIGLATYFGTVDLGFEFIIYVLCEDVNAIQGFECILI